MGNWSEQKSYNDDHLTTTSRLQFAFISNVTQLKRVWQTFLVFDISNIKIKSVTKQKLLACENCLLVFIMVKKWVHQNFANYLWVACILTEGYTMLYVSTLVNQKM